ncbi:MAG: hypothetical protein WBO66_02285, partial [Candidatus Moraniibacteriota bacterium]
NMQELIVGLSSDYYGDPDGGLLRRADIPADSRIVCSVAVSFTGLSYYCDRRGLRLDGENAVPSEAVKKMRIFFHRIQV